MVGMATRTLALSAAIVLAGCWREQRLFHGTAQSSAPPVQQSPLTPGLATPARHFDHPYLSNAYAVSQGKLLYGWYNCVGCHAHGGGGMGPALMDARWIYGADPEEVYASIAEGRPNGMPSWRGRIPPDQIWQLVAYVLSMSGNARMDATAGRSDEMHVGKAESMRHRATPRGQGGAPP
jgi:cytochrome c oxidase cbb3-type subunit 3